MKIVAILRNRRMYEILKPFLAGFDVKHYTNVDDFLKDITKAFQYEYKDKYDNANTYPFKTADFSGSFLREDLALIVNAGISIGSDILSFKNIKLIQQFGIGFENIDIKEASLKGISVFNVPTKGTANATSCAELAIFYALALARDYNGCINSISHGIANEPTGISLAGKKFGIIGLGGIGLEVVRILKPFNVIIYAIKNSKPDKDYAKELGVAFIGTFNGDFRNILQQLDFIIFAAPLNEQTENMLNEETILLLKDGCFVINVGRAGVINKKAFINGLKSGKIKGAGLDVLWDEPAHISDEIFHFNVIATPHIGGATAGSIRDISRICIENIKGWIDKKDFSNCINKELL